MDISEYPNIVYIMGYGYSGSTLLDTLFGNCPNIESVGELNNFYRYTWNRNKKCACGRKACQCEFWSEVDRQWRLHTGESGNVNYLRLQKMYESYLNPITWLKLFRINIKNSDPSFDVYSRFNLELYKAILEIGGKKIVVDSSKSPPRAAALTLTPLNIHTIHLVRDSRAVVWSKLKRVKNGKTKTFKQFYAVLRTSLGWIVTNLQSELVRRIFLKNKHSVVKYEDIVLNSGTALKDLKRVNFFDFTEFVKLMADDQMFNIGHTICGNKMRKHSAITIQPDFEWHANLPWTFKILASILTFPLLVKYGYKLRTPKPHPET